MPNALALEQHHNLGRRFGQVLGVLTILTMNFAERERAGYFTSFGCLCSVYLLMVSWVSLQWVGIFPGHTYLLKAI